jgi:hypothetical protein
VKNKRTPEIVNVLNEEVVKYLSNYCNKEKLALIQKMIMSGDSGDKDDILDIVRNDEDQYYHKCEI